jgi:GNAT superfamily N-acetyltransferase
LSFRVEQVANPKPEEIERLQAGLTSFNRSMIPNRGYVPLFFTLTDEAGEFAGGLSAYVAYAWLFIDKLWVAEAARTHGWGSKLMRAAEEAGCRYGCRGAWVDTFSFQARGFYEKLGYEVFGTLEDFPPGHQRYFLRKTL